MATFVHLHTHSEYSILDSSCKVTALVERALECGMEALALTDHGVMSGAVKFYRAARKRNVKPIIGAEVYLAPGDRRERRTQDGQRYSHLVLLAENGEGYRNLLALVSLGHTEGFYYRPRVDKELLRRHARGLIALSACESGEIPRLLLAGRQQEAETAAADYAEIFGEGNFFIELQDHGTDHCRILRERLPALARRLSLPIVATNDTHYLAPEDQLAHEVLLNIRANRKLSDPDRRTFSGSGYHFRTHEEMETLFADLPEAIESTSRIAERCNVELEFGNSMIPPFEIPDEMPDANAYLRHLAVEGAGRIFGTPSNEAKERLNYELSVIERMDYATYFLIVWDFVRFARESGIPVGPGRGSATGSLVSYCLGITRVDPLKYDLIFERFLNPDRISMPDFDIDFCIKGRDKVIDYVRRKYGGEKWWSRSAQIATFDRMAARSVIRDVGRVLGVPYGTTDRVAKMIPFGQRLQTALKKVPELRSLSEHDEEIRKIIEIGLRLEGLTRNASTHAAGVVIAADELIRHVPLMRLTDGEIVTQFDMGDVEAVGLLKFDFLGLRNLTLIAEAVSSLRKHVDVEIDIDAIPLDNEKTFELLRSGHTAGIFQLESSGMTALIKRVQPDRFEDLIALLALFRPGPLESGMTDEFVERRGGRQPITYPHPSLEPVLKDTYGLPIYQDQLMQMARTLAGFTLAEADVLRKAMGKKDKVMMESLREKFVTGCEGNGISRGQAVETFGDMEKFARYGFNKSHTTAYAFISYWTAYLKANHPTHFMASLLASVQGDTDKAAEYIGECGAMEIEVLPPDINESEREFTPLADGRIRFGLGAIKHVGGGAIEAIVAAREDGFDSLFDLCRRIHGEGIDREALEALIKSGALDSFGVSRRGMLMRASDALETMQVTRRERLSGQRSFFEDLAPAATDPTISEEEFPRAELLAFEKDLLGLYISAHPLDHHRETMCVYCLPLSQIESMQGCGGATVGGRVKKVRRIQTRNGGQMAFATIEDGTGEIEVTAFPKILEAISPLLVEDALLGMRLSAGDRNGELNLILEEAFPLEELERRSEASVEITLHGNEIDASRLGTLCASFRRHPGTAPVTLRIREDHGVVDVVTGSEFRVAPSTILLRELESLLGEGRVRVRNGGAP